jgi:SAM-dependent methyltransferase
MLASSAPGSTLAAVIAAPATQTHAGSEPYRERNLLDRLTPRDTLEAHYSYMMRRERELVERRLGLGGGEVLSVGAGWHPGRHLFPALRFTLTAVDADPDRVHGVLETGRADQAYVGHAGRLDWLPDRSFDVVLDRLVLHHLIFQGPLQPIIDEAARLLRPGGALLAIEPGMWNPIGLGLALANRVGAATAIHGTPDDVPLSPRALVAAVRAAGLTPELHAVTYTWRRLPRPLQRALRPLDDALGSRPRSAPFGHTLMVIGRMCELPANRVVRR